MKRIVEETLHNGHKQYRVETNRIFGFIPCKWHTDTFYDAKHDMTFAAVFHSIDEAYAYIRLHESTDPESNTIISRCIIN